MRTMFVQGFEARRSKFAMGQFDIASLISTIVVTGAKASLEWYTAKRAADQAKKFKEEQEARLKATQAAQEAKEKAQQEVVQAEQQQAAASAAAAGGAEPTILGVPQTPFLIGAGVLGLGTIILLMR